MAGRNSTVAVLGATSIVGESLLSLLMQSNNCAIAFSRQPKRLLNLADKVEWKALPIDSDAPISIEDKIESWISVAPIWVLADYFPLLQAHGVKRVVALSSTSRFSKTNSSNTADQTTAQHLIDGEKQLRQWAEKSGIEWVILRPTLVYGQGKDKNIAEIARFVQRFGFFPLLGNATGLRQPIHVSDVANTCIAALKSPNAAFHAYNISGGDTIPYHEMVRRVFLALNRKPRMISIPTAALKIALIGMRLIPRYRYMSFSMAERMNSDLVFDHEDAIQDLNFSPRPFQIGAEDIISESSRE